MAGGLLGGAFVAGMMGGASCGSSYGGNNNGGSYAGAGGSGQAGNGGGSGGANANQAVYNMQLSGAQEVPANTSGASATVKVVLDRTTGDVTVTGMFQGLTSNATVAHIHGPAAVGMNATVIVPLTVPAATSGTVMGSGTMDATHMNAMIGGMTYVNIHSQNFPDGEIRAQIQ